MNANSEVLEKSTIRPGINFQESPFQADSKTPTETVLGTGHKLYLRLSDFVGSFFPKGQNPLAQTGAIANTSFIIAAITGILLLIWYKPSVHQAYGSMVEISSMTFTAGLLRSLHRYSSDGCMFLVVLHTIHMFMGGRFRGARWLAWGTGVLAMTLLWAVGWTGYWLVWDERAQLVATSSAKLLDVVPIFSDPMSRSFLINETVNSLFFFVVFFAHMLIPMAIGVALWIHIIRLSRPTFLADKKTTLWVVVSLVLLSLLVPATETGAADMLSNPQTFTMDWWYLTPLWIIDRLSGGFFWILFLAIGGLLYTLPFWKIGKKREAALVVESRCNACRNCLNDCPYNAITMVPRSDNKSYDSTSLVDPAKCVSCGICAGSCDSAGIGLPQFPVLDVRRGMEALLQNDEEKDTWFAFVCGESATVSVDEKTGSCPQLPGYKVRKVPCIGWVHMLSLERLLKRGAQGILLAGCGNDTCKYREGHKWTEMRLSGSRDPGPRKTDGWDKVKLVSLGGGGIRKLQKEAALFKGGTTPETTAVPKWIKPVVGVALLLLFMVIPVNLPFSPTHGDKGILVVSFKHAGAEHEARKLSQEELEKLPVHMRNPNVRERGRSPVRLRILVDDKELVNASYKPGGLMSDGASVALERFELSPGTHKVQVFIGDTSEPDAWPHSSEKTIHMKPYKNCVLLFDRLHGFSWHGGEP